MPRYLIVGGVAGGATTAARLRRNDEHAEIILFERGDYISYANCGLPYYIGDVIRDREKLFVQTPSGFGTRFKVDVRIRSEVTEIDRLKKSITVKKTDTGELYTERYDKLVLSPGAVPVRPPIPGIESDRIFTLRSVPDTDRIKAFIEEKKPSRVVIVGAGFIGLEMAENFHAKGVFVTIIEMADQVMNVLDFEMASMVHQHLKTKNVEFYLNDGVAFFEKRDDERLSVALSSGKALVADMVVLSIGVKPELTLAKSAGLSIGSAGGIATDDRMRTSDPDIYALGDAVEVTNPVIGKKVLIPLAGPANKQGRIVADNIAFGDKSAYGGSIGTAIAKVFDLTVASTGASEKLLRRERIPYIASITHSGSHAGYYPGAIPMAIKILFSPDKGAILGAQIVGFNGVDKRIDVFASFVASHKTIYDLEQLEHAYAPPYSSAKDPVNIAGFVAENILEKKVAIVHWYDIKTRDLENTLLLDVRTPEEFALGTIENAINIPVDEIRERMREIPKQKKLIVFCGVGLRAYVAIRILGQNGYGNICNLSGGYKTYEYATKKQGNEDIYQGDFIGKNDDIYQTNVETHMHDDRTIYKTDATGLQCPGPIMRLKLEIEKIAFGDRLEIKASDPGFLTDVRSWCNVTGNLLIALDQSAGIITALVEKSPDTKPAQTGKAGTGKTIIVFSDDFDKALAAFVIANGALSMGRHVTMFFTFWGLNIIKRKKHPKVKKDFMGRMFASMMAKHSEGLGLSKMNMAGMGPAMMRMRMKSKKIDSLEEMIAGAIAGGIEIIACQMSMDVMGVKKEELLDGIRIGGVATYLEEAEKSGLNLFI